MGRPKPMPRRLGPKGKPYDEGGKVSGN